MDVSDEVENLLTTINILEKSSEEHIKPKFTAPEITLIHLANEIIDVSQIDFSNDETWLYKLEDNDNVTDIEAWLRNGAAPVRNLDFEKTHLTLMGEIAKLDNIKKIDSRTYTRPKKRFSRPSIDFTDSRFKITEIHNNSVDDPDLCESISENRISCEDTIVNGTAVNFDFSQPINIFNNITKCNPDLDSFQNMSPPSLVSSSMFSSLMENSYIKNDPVLREIRDTDYTDVILQGDPSLLKSFTGSCSSIDSDTPEGFLKRSVETTFIKNDKRSDVTDGSLENVLNETFVTNNTNLLNSTFQKEPMVEKLRSFSHLTKEAKQSPHNRSSNKSSSILNNTYCTKDVKDNLNDTFSVTMRNDNENIKNAGLNRTVIIKNDNDMDSNRLSYSKRSSCIIDDTKCDSKYSKFLKSNRYSLGSNDSLDCASSPSNSSSGKGSSKMLNMAEVDAIVLQQEQSLQQVMSTPNPKTKYGSKFSEYTHISPIKQLEQPEHFSDSDVSSNDDYLTVDSGSSKSITSGNSDSALFVQPKNLINLKNKMSVGIPKNLPTTNKQTHYGSYTNLHKSKLLAQQGLQRNLASIGNIPRACAQSNLKSMDVKLKSSYTQLKPMFTNLPSALLSKDKELSSNVGKVKVPDGPLKIAEVVPTLRDQPKTSTIVNTAKLAPRPSGLPRPVTAIPRPTGSRIPAPLSFRSGLSQSRPTSKVNVNTDF